MADMDKAVATQLANITKRTGKSLDDFAAIMRASGLAKHGELRELLKNEHGLGHGDANAVVHTVLNPPAASSSAVTGVDLAVVDAIYTGPKASLRPVHDRLMQELAAFGDFEVAPKKGYLSLRRKKQFAMIGPATDSKVEIGFNMKSVDATDRLISVPPGGTCNYKLRLGDPSEVDAALVGWPRQAYDSAGRGSRKLTMWGGCWCDQTLDSTRSPSHEDTMSKRPNTGRVDDKPGGWKRGNESLIPAKGTPPGKRAPAKLVKAGGKKKK